MDASGKIPIDSNGVWNKPLQAKGCTMVMLPLAPDPADLPDANYETNATRFQVFCIEGRGAGGSETAGGRAPSLQWRSDASTSSIAHF